MNLRKLCMDLAYCEEESAVINLLKINGLWDAPKAWHYYGDNENNFATIGNQQSKPDSAIVEKIINAEDAMLIAQCLRRKMDPSGPGTPSNISEALVEYFEIPDGKLSNLTPSERKILSENICLMATGSKTNPCYSIIDKGEGQTPNAMPNTLLSIGRSNKLRIPFVQGKFNMGGTGVLQFCGRYNIQLIISKRDPLIAKHEEDDSQDLWGFTIVRREDPGNGMRSSTYRYLAPDGKILSFNGDGLPLLPGNYPQPYVGKLEWGTFIKLYEYQMTGLKTNVVFDLYNRLALLMPTLAIPIRLYERRKGYTGHTLETTLSGLTVRLDEDRRENLEVGFPTSSTISAKGQKMKASIYAFKRNQTEKYSRGEGIIFTVNGQTHGYLSKNYFSQKSVGMGYLADSLLVIVDCSEFDGRSREDLFMNSRDRLRAGDLRSDILNILGDLLKNHSGLRELKEQRRRSEIESKIGDAKPLADVLENILKKSPTLSKLFIDGGRLPNPFKLDKAKAAKSYEGKRFPSFFTLIEKYPATNPKICHKNCKCRIQFKTDATNDYFDRDSDPGTFTLKINSEEYKDYSINLWNGIATLTICPPPDSSINDILHFKTEVNDLSRVEAFEDELYVVVKEEIVKKESKTKSRKDPSSDEKGSDIEKESYLDLPNIIPVKKDEWDKHSFDKESALQVIDNGDEGYDFFINVDNIHLLTEQKMNSTTDPKLLDARYKYGMVLLGIALLKSHDDSEKTSDEGEENIFSKISDVTKSISPVLLPMIASLGDLEVETNEKVFQEV